MKNKLPTRWNQLINQNVLSTPYLLDEAIRQWGMVEQNVINHHNSYYDIYHNLNGGAGPIEKNPYIHVYKDDFDIKRENLILSPFPAKYGNDVEIDYYYGDSLDIWDYFFGLVNLKDSETSIKAIRNSLKAKSVSITDVFEYTQRINMQKTSVEDLANIVLNLGILKAFKHGSRVQRVYTCSGDLTSLLDGVEGNVDTTKGLYWAIQEEGEIEKYTISCEKQGKYYPFDVEGISNVINQQNGKIDWWIRRKNKTIHLISLPNPSSAASIKMITPGGFFERWVRWKAVENGIPEPDENQLMNLNAYMKEQYPQVFTNSPTTEYRRDIYQKALANELDQI